MADENLRSAHDQALALSALLHGYSHHVGEAIRDIVFAAIAQLIDETRECRGRLGGYHARDARIAELEAEVVAARESNRALSEDRDAKMRQLAAARVRKGADR